MSNPTSVEPAHSSHPTATVEPAYSPHPTPQDEPAYSTQFHVDAPPQLAMANQNAYDRHPGPHVELTQSAPSASNEILTTADGTKVSLQKRPHSSSSNNNNGHDVIIIEHPGAGPIERTVLKPGESRRHTYQLSYPIIYLLLATCFIIMGLVPRWENQNFAKYRAIRPIMLVAMCLAGIMFIVSLTHTIYLVVSGRSQWHNAQKRRTTTNTLFYTLNLVMTLVMTLLFLTCFLIMLFNFNEFHKVIDMLGAVTWWCSMIIAIPCLVWMNLRTIYDLIQLCRRPTPQIS